MMELICPSGNLSSLKVAIDNGADAVYIGFKNDTNARHFAGLNFSDKDIAIGIEYAHSNAKKVFVAINTYAQADGWQRWQTAVDRAADLGVNALIIADIAVMEYAHKKYPELNLHLSVQGSATSQAALRFYQQQFAIKRAVIPRVLSVAQVEQLVKHSPCEIEVFAFGSLCIMVEGRCQLSSYVTGESPNTCGACSPAAFVQWQERGAQLDSRLNGVLIDRFEAHENAGYPTLCKGRFIVNGRRYHALEEPTSLNTMELLPTLLRIGVKAIKIEGRQRSPAYIGQVTRTWRKAIDQLLREPEKYQTNEEWNTTLTQLSEGAQTTLGAYHRSWQ